MEKSKSPQSTYKEVATYVISSHGMMLTSLSAQHTKKYYAIDIPKNVELYTFTNLGKCVAGYKTDADFICKNYKEKLQMSHAPAFKFSNEHGENNKFPELFLTPDEEINVLYLYSGIIHCIPEHHRTGDDSRKKEVIYNIDTKNTKDCNCYSINSNNSAKSYNCEKNYSDYYKTQLKGYKYNPASNINKCGPILMSEAVKIIQTHCSNYYGSTCMIKIYIFACLVEIDLYTLVSSNRMEYKKAYRIAYPPPPTPLSRLHTNESCVFIDPHTGRNNPKSCVIEKSSTRRPELSYAVPIPIPNRNKTIAIEESLDTTREVKLMEHYYELINHNTLNKVVLENVVESLTDFNAKPLIEPLISKYRFMIKYKIFDIITYKDTYKEFTPDLRKGVSGTPEQVIEKLETKYRSLDINKLGRGLINALNKITVLDGNDLTILPEINEISLVHPFITKVAKVNEPAFINVIYGRLKILIDEAKKQKLASGRRRRKKTLRQRKFPYVKKKSIKKKLTKKA